MNWSSYFQSYDPATWGAWECVIALVVLELAIIAFCCVCSLLFDGWFRRRVLRISAEQIALDDARRKLDDKIRHQYSFERVGQHMVIDKEASK